MWVLGDDPIRPWVGNYCCNVHPCASGKWLIQAYFVSSFTISKFYCMIQLCSVEIQTKSVQAIGEGEQPGTQMCIPAPGISFCYLLWWINANCENLCWGNSHNLFGNPLACAGAYEATHVVPGSALIISWGIYGLILNAIIITKGLLSIAILHRSSSIVHGA